MGSGAPVSVVAGASSDIPPVSPPPLDSLPSFTNSELVTAPEASQAVPSTTTDTTPSGSPARVTPAPEEQQGTQQVPNSRDLPTTPETERSASEGVATPTESEKDNGVAQNGTTAAAEIAPTGGVQATGQQKKQVSATSAQTEKKVAKNWFDVLPMVLQNFKTQDREQIRQLMLPCCELCKRGKVDKKAMITCSQEGCSLKGRSLCSSCWNLTHYSESGRKHSWLPVCFCRQCHLKRVAYWCAECDLQFCSDCFEHIHSVPRTRHHRKLATEDAPGTCIGKSHWAANFQQVISHMITARKRLLPVSKSSSGDSVGLKRKRDVEVIVIDSSDDETDRVMKSVEAKPTLANEVTGQQVETGNSSTTGIAETESAVSRSSELFSQLQVPVQPPSISALFQAPAAQHSMMEPIPFPREPTGSTSMPLSSPDIVQTTAAYTTSSGANTVNITSSVGDLQWNGSASQFGATASSSAAYATNVMSNGMLHVLPSSMPAAVSTTDGMWSTTSAISTDLVSTSNPSNLLPLGGAVFAENALVDSLVDRYHEVNQNVTTMERQSEQLTRQIAVATCQGPYVAGPIMALLSKLQPVLEAARVRRDKLLIAMIIQSSDIMTCVRRLRLTELGDVPQVPMISHRKCLQISNEINHHKKKLIELNQHLSETLTQSRAVSSSWESTFIRSTSANIQMHEKSIKELKKAREVEFVRIVQFSLKVREALKVAFQRTVDRQRQQQQRQPIS